MAVAAPIAPYPTLTATVLVVDDHQSFAELLAGALSAAGMTVLGTAQSANQAVALAAELLPDLVVMDVEMPREDGLAATRRILQASPETAVAVVTAHRDPAWVVRAAQAGASAFIPKNGSVGEMIDVLSRVRRGQMLVSPSAFSATAGEKDVPARPEAPALTRREREILDCLGRGMQVKAISRVLGITVQTCRGYVKSLLAKLGVRSQLEAVVRAQELGMLTTGTQR